MSVDVLPTTTQRVKSTNLSVFVEPLGNQVVSRIFRLFKVAPIMYFKCSCMCLQYRHLTDTVYAFSLSSLEEENVRSKVSAAKSGP